MKKTSFFQFNIFAPPLFENSVAHRGLKMCTHYPTKGIYKSDAAIFLILSNFEITTPDQICPVGCSIKVMRCFSEKNVGHFVGKNV